jgi:glyoxylase-like metal-dependent hydrolase (beta-lactamase superfamily II)
MSGRVAIGSTTVLSLSDIAIRAFDIANIFPDVPLDTWQTSYPDEVTAENKLQTNMGCFLIRSQGLTILVDSGIGPGPIGFLGGAGGQLLEDMKNAGISANEIDIAVFTHLHGDHVGWNTYSDNGTLRPTFSKARYLIPKGDYEYFSSPGVIERSGHMDTAVFPIRDLGLMDLVEGGHNVTSEVTLVATPGHTPGHVSVAIASGGEQGFILGDVLTTPAQIENPQWSPTLDVDPDRARETRGKILDRLEKDKSLVGAGHFLAPSFGHILRANGKRYWQKI